MPWRAFILLLSGIAIIYLINLLQDSPYPYPVKIHTYDATRLNIKPDHVILTAQGEYLYETAINYEATLVGKENTQIGLGPLKTGVVGYIRQMRRPIAPLLGVQEQAAEDAWTLSWEHAVDGPITKVSQLNGEDPKIQFGVLYHVIDGESIRHYARVYYLVNDTKGDMDSPFAYKDLLLPGSTYIQTFSLERDSILYSREPDIYHYRILKLPEHFTESPHSEEALALTLDSSEPGQETRKWHQPLQTEKHQLILLRLYSPASETYRVLTHDIHKTKDVFFVNITIADNATTVSQLSTLRGDTGGRWRWREHAGNQYDAMIDYSVNYVHGFSDMSHIPQESVPATMPKQSLARSKYSKTVVFPYFKRTFLSLDFTDRIDLLQADEMERDHLYKSEEGTILPEFYTWHQYDVDVSDTYDSEITGIQINEDGDLLAVWTELNMVYVYRRDEINASQIPGRAPSILDQIDQWLFGISWDEPELQEGLPSKWHLRMVVSRSESGLNRWPVKAVTFVRDHLERNYMLIALKSGAVRSYLIDAIEDPQKATLWTFIAERWNMVIAMAIVIMTFVANEYMHH